METVLQRCSRLLRALEEFAAQEAASLAAGDFATVLGLQQRAGPLVTYLGTHGPDVADESLRSRVGALLERRRDNEAALARRIQETRSRLGELDSNRRRVAKVIPAYVQGAGPSHRLRALG